MQKIFIHAALVLALLSQSIPAFFAAEMDFSDEKGEIIYYINEDFSGDSPLDKSSWMVSKRGGNVSIVNAVEPDDEENDEVYADNEKVLRLSGSVAASEDFPRVAIALPYAITSGRFVIESRVRNDEPFGNYGNFSVGVIGMSSIVMASRKTFTVNSINGAGGAFSNGSWYDYKISVDLDIKKVDVWINGNLTLEHADFARADAASASEIVISGYPERDALGNNVTFDVEYIRVYSEDKKASETKPVAIGEKYREAFDVLTAIGLWTEPAEAFMPEHRVKREEFVTLLPRLFGLGEDELLDFDKPFYRDVDGWVRRCAYYAWQQNLMIGYPDGSFYPENNITLNEAVKSLVCALGYEWQAESKGGYPVGYRVVASQTGLTSGISIASDELLTAGDFILLIYNLLDIDIMKNMGVTNGVVSYHAEKGVNIMTEYLHIRKGADGIMTANSQTGLAEPNGVKGGVEIAKTRYLTDSTKYDDLLGHRVRFYYQFDPSDNSDFLIKYMISAGNDVLNVEAGDIAGVFGNLFRYVVGSREQSVLINKQYFIYNGKICDFELDMSLLTPKSGNVMFIDNDSDGIYDVINVTSYQNMIISSANETINTIYGIHDDSVDVRDGCEIYKDGKEIAFTELKRGNAAAVAQSINVSGKKVTKIYITAKLVFGTIMQKDADAVWIDGKEYKISPFYGGNEPLLTTGLSSIFYLDIDGKIIGLNTSGNVENGARAGYIINTTQRKGLHGGCEFRIIDINHGILRLNGANSITIDGKRYSSADSIIVKLSETARTAGETDQLVGYAVNANGEISQIETTAYILGFSSASAYYRASSRLFVDKQSVFLKANASVFFVPSLHADDDHYKVVGVSELTENMYYSGVDAYNLSDVFVAEIAVVSQESVSTISTTAAFFLVEKVTQIVYEGMSTRKIYGYQGGEARTLLVHPDAKVSELRPGDVIRYARKSGMIDSVHIMFSLLDKPSPELSGNYGSEVHYVYGYLQTADDTGFTISILPKSNSEGFILYPFIFGSIPIYLFDARNETIRTVDRFELAAYTYGKGTEARMLVRAANTGALSFTVLSVYE